MVTTTFITAFSLKIYQTSVTWATVLAVTRRPNYDPSSCCYENSQDPKSATSIHILGFNVTLLR